MTVPSNGCTEGTVSVGAAGLAMIRGGSGRPLLVLHEELGHPGWLSWHTQLAEDHSIYIPIHPGFGQLPRVDWISGVRDLAGFYSRMLREMALGPVDVIGFSLGGWIAAEMAAANPGQFRRLVMVAPAGLKPPEGGNPGPFRGYRAGLPGRHRPRRCGHAGVRLTIRRRGDSGPIRVMGRCPRRVGPAGLEALHAQSHPGSVA